MFDTGAQSLIVSHDVLHAIGRHLECKGRTLPALREPCTTLFGKDRDKGPKIIVTAQFDATMVKRYVPPCLSNLIVYNHNCLAYIGVSITRANGEALITFPQPEPTIARVFGISHHNSESKQAFC